MADHELDPTPLADVWGALPGTEPLPIELYRDGCRWPIGEHPVTYCSAPVDVGRIYCPEHCAIAYKPLPPGVR